jgi:hypothetical protein
MATKEDDARVAKLVQIMNNALMANRIALEQPVFNEDLCSALVSMTAHHFLLAGMDKVEAMVNVGLAFDHLESRRQAKGLS